MTKNLPLLLTIAKTCESDRVLRELARMFQILSAHPGVLGSSDYHMEVTGNWNSAHVSLCYCICFSHFLCVRISEIIG